MKEKQVWRILQKHFKECGARAHRIENLMREGCPDVNYCLDGVEGWIEIKCPTLPKRASTILFGSNHKLSQQQKNWFKEQIDAGGRCHVLIVTGLNWLLIEGKNADAINDLTYGELFEISVWKGDKNLFGFSSELILE